MSGFRNQLGVHRYKFFFLAIYLPETIYLDHDMTACGTWDRIWAPAFSRLLSVVQNETDNSRRVDGLFNQGTAYGQLHHLEVDGLLFTACKQGPHRPGLLTISFTAQCYFLTNQVLFSFGANISEFRSVFIKGKEGIYLCQCRHVTVHTHF